MKKLLVALFAVLAQGVASASVGVAAPYIELRAGDGSVRVVPGDGSVTVEKKGDVETWRVGQIAIGGNTFSDLVFAFDPDPFMAFAVTIAKGTSSPTNFSFAFLVPFVGGPYGHVSSQLDGSVDAADGTATLSAVTHTTSVDAVDRLTTAMPNCSSSGALQSCISTAGATSIPSTGATGLFGLTLSFTLDAPAVATFSGRSDLLASSPVPTPATLPLAMLALSGLGWTVHRRRAASHG